MRVAVLLAALLLAAAPAPFSLNPAISLASLMTVSDAHLVKFADTLHTIAATGDARAADWTRIRPWLARAAAQNAPAVVWFAHPDGSYFTLEGGRQRASLRSRPYWPTLLAGRAVLGHLVVSKAARTAVAIVAVPVMRNRAVVGVLGASIYLDRLSDRIKREMDMGPGVIFYSFDENALVGLNWDRTLVFLEPRRLSPELDRAFLEMLRHRSGVETYRFRGRTRTVLYRRSAVTGWWYAIGVVR